MFIFQNRLDPSWVKYCDYGPVFFFQNYTLFFWDVWTLLRLHITYSSNDCLSGFLIRYIGKKTLRWTSVFHSVQLNKMSLYRSGRFVSFVSITTLWRPRPWCIVSWVLLGCDLKTARHTFERAMLRCQRCFCWVFSQMHKLCTPESMYCHYQ